MEIWKVISFEQNYEVSNMGNVRHVRTKKIRKLSETIDGYLKVTLYPSWKSYSVHRLVGFMWVDGYFEGAHIDHIDRNRKNNVATNLQWLTVRENNARVIDRVPMVGSTNPMSILDESAAYFAKYQSFDLTNAEVAEILGVNVEVIRSIRVNDSWKHVVNKELDIKIANGDLKYKIGKYANLDDTTVGKVKDMILAGHRPVDIIKTLGVSKSTVYRHLKRY